LSEVLRARERQREILAVARADGRVDVTSAADRFGVAAETIRRDLKMPERNGFVRRSYGTAYPVARAGFEGDLAYRELNRQEEKL
jgi:DeoR family fructose operon transcriptional repressor